MFENTIDFLKNSNLIYQDDVIIICKDNNNTSWSQSSIIGAIIEDLALDIFLVAANEESIRIFDVDKTSGEYLGKCRYFKREEVVKANVSGFLGSFGILIKTTSGVYRYFARTTLKGYYQREQLLKLRDLFKFLF